MNNLTHEKIQGILDLLPKPKTYCMNPDDFEEYLKDQLDREERSNGYQFGNITIFLSKYVVKGTYFELNTNFMNSIFDFNKYFE